MESVERWTKMQELEHWGTKTVDLGESMLDWRLGNQPYDRLITSLLEHMQRKLDRQRKDNEEVEWE